MWTWQGARGFSNSFCREHPTRISFSDLCQLLRHLGFDERVRGDHHIFTKTGVEEILNLQPKRTKAKPYQVKQVRRVLLKYELENDTA